MDGGRVLRAALAARKGLVPGTLLAVKVARAIAIGLGILGAFSNYWLIAMAMLVWWMGSSELAQMRRHEALRDLGYRDENIDPWARYAKAADRDRPLEPEVMDAPGARADQGHPASVLAGLMGQQPPESPRGEPVTRQRVVRDAYGRHVVVTETAYRW